MTMHPAEEDYYGECGMLPPEALGMAGPKAVAQHRALFNSKYITTHTSNLGFERSDLDMLVKAGLVAKRSHNQRNLDIYCHTSTCKYRKVWDNVTLAARGLVISYTQELIVRPMRQFFSVEEYEAAGFTLPKELPVVLEKYDGVMLNAYAWGMAVHFATKFGFEGDETRLADEMLSKEQAQVIHDERDQHTFVFEYLNPSGQGVVDYGTEPKLVLLAVIEKATGEERPLKEYNKLFFTPKQYMLKAENTADLVAKLKMKFQGDSNREGFVLYWPKTGLRLKLKLPMFKELNKLINNVNPHRIWMFLQTGQSLETIFSGVPEESFEDVEQIAKELMSEYDKALGYTQHIFAARPTTNSRKEIASYFGEYPKISEVLFKMLDGKEYSYTLWKLVAPRNPEVTNVVQGN